MSHLFYQSFVEREIRSKNTSRQAFLYFFIVLKFSSMSTFDRNYLGILKSLVSY